MTWAQFSPLANHLWQSTVCVGVAWTLTLALSKNRAAVRYGVWLAASVKFLVPFAWLAAIGARFEWRSAEVTAPVRIPAVVAQIGQPFAVIAPEPALSVGRTSGSAFFVLLLAIWLCGVLVGLAFWARSIWRMRGIVRGAKPLDLPLPIPVKTAPGRMEPGVFGIWKPVLLLPEGIAERLTPQQLEAVLAHELRHVHRRDNFTAAVHMLVETLFWFHPAVWWIRTRLIDERERACDEGALRMGSEPRVYAESILKVCEFYLAAPAACASGVSGGSLKRRIEDIVGGRFGIRLGVGRRILLAAAAMLAALSPFAIGVFHPLLRAQESDQHLTFDVASLKVASDQRILWTRPERSPGRFTWNTQLAYLIQYAFHLEWDRVLGYSDHIPGWADIYDLAATMSPTATEDQVRLMVRSLLEDRLKMTWRFETKTADGWVVSVAKSGAKIHAYRDTDPAPPYPDWVSGEPADAAAWDHIISTLGLETGVWGVLGRRVSVMQLCQNLERNLGAAVWDETGMKGKYYVAFRYAPADAPVDADAPPLNAALRENLGLQIEKHKGPAQYVVIDHIEKTPTEN
ncbi:MAG TPA: M56 family metallopeptidase [Bryobacteraceae bacterium]|nr:M56 family metallopeptidase [Bryobacteraceae bacterium]